MNRFRNPNIAVRLLLWFILVGVVPLALVTIVSYSLSSQSLTEQITTALDTIAEDKAQQVDSYISERQKDVATLSRQQSIKEALESYALAFPNGINSAEYLAVDELIKKELEDYAQANGYYDLFLISKAGDIVFSAARENDFGTNLYTGEYNNTTLAKVFVDTQTILSADISDFNIYAPSGEPAAFIAAPVFKDGELIGAIALQLATDILYSTVNDYSGLGVSGEIQVGSQTGNEIVYVNPLRNDPEAAFNTTTLIGSDTGLAMQEAVFGVHGNAVTTDYRNKEVVASWRYLPRVRWGMVVKIDTEEAFEAVSTQRNVAFFMGIASLLGVLFIAVLVARSISNPIVNLTGVAQKIAEGDIELAAKVETTDEIGTLAQAFNTMTSQLREFIASLEERVAARTRDQAVVAEIATEIATMQNAEEMLSRMVHLTQRGFGLYHAHVFTFHEENPGEELQIIACGYREGDEDAGTHGTTTIDFNNAHSIVARCARERQPVIVNDVRNSPDWLPNPSLPETRSEMALPMIVGDKLMGVLDVQAETVDRFTPEDATVKSTLASQIAVALQNLNQYEETQKIASDLSVVAEVGIATSTVTETDKLLQEIVDLSKESFALYHAHIYLLNREGDTLQLASGAGEVGRKMVSQGLSIPLESPQSLVARAARTQQGVIVNDVTLDPNFLPNPLLPETRAEMAVPMLVGNRVLGVLDVQSERVGRFSPLDVNIKTTLAAQIAVALQNARSFENAQKQAERETTLNLITQKIQQTDTIEEAMQIAARELGHALGKRKTMVSLNVGAMDKTDQPTAILES